MNISKIDTSPELKFRAIHKEMGTAVYFTLEDTFMAYFTLEDIFQDDVGACVPCNEDSHLLLPECRIDLWTGGKDKDGKDVYGRDVVEARGETKNEYAVVNCRKDGAWRLVWLLDRREYSIIFVDEYQVIGNIHQFDQLPPEVRELLK